MESILYIQRIYICCKKNAESMFYDIDAEKDIISVGGPAAIRTQDLPVISRVLHLSKLRAH